MGKMSELQTVIAELRSAAETINSAAESLEEMFSAETPAEAKPAMTLPEIRAILAEKSRAGFTAEVRSMLLKHGADKLSAIDPAEYPALAAEAEVLGNG